MKTGPNLSINSRKRGSGLDSFQILMNDHVLNPAVTKKS